MVEESTAALSEAVKPVARRPKTEQEQYGERLNTVRGTRCPKHRSSSTMSVHPGHRVYHPCGCAHELPPLPVNRTYEARRGSGAKPKGAAK